MTNKTSGYKSFYTCMGIHFTYIKKINAYITEYPIITPVVKLCNYEKILTFNLNL